MVEPGRLNYAVFGAMDMAIASVFAEALNPISQENLRTSGAIDLNVFCDAIITVMETCTSVTMYVANRKPNLDRTDLYCTTGGHNSLLSAPAGSSASVGGYPASPPLSIEDGDEEEDDDDDDEADARKSKKKVSRTSSCDTYS